MFGNAMTIDAQGRLLNRLEFGEWGLPDLMAFRIICQPAVLMRRSVLEGAGYLDAAYHFMLDHHLWLRLAWLAPVRHFPGVWAAARHHNTAKNVAQADKFGEEIFRIQQWMHAQPDLAPSLASQHRRIEAGAYRLDARYLLDAGQPGDALRSYGYAFVNDPSYTWRHWRRIAYAATALLGLGGFADWLLRGMPRHTASPIDLGEAGSWPGLLFYNIETGILRPTSQ